MSNLGMNFLKHVDFLLNNACISIKSLKAFRQIIAREPNWRKKTSVKCDVMFAILNACWSVLNQ